MSGWEGAAGKVPIEVARRRPTLLRRGAGGAARVREGYVLLETAAGTGNYSGWKHSAKGTEPLGSTTI